MTENLPQPRRVALAAELSEVAASFDAFSVAMLGVNDEALIDAFRDLLHVAPPIIVSHQTRIGPTLADDMATLNSLVGRYPIPREDPDLGRTERLQALRAARGNLVADIESVLVAAKALGLVPSHPEIDLPPATVVERAGLEGLLSGLVRRLDDVEQGLKRVAAEADPEAQPSVRQFGLINLYVGSMEIELALAKLEASAKKLIDLSGLGRAIEAIGTLTTDFIATTKGMVRSIGTGLRDAAKAMEPTVGKLVSGMKTLSVRLWRRGSELTNTIPAQMPMQQSSFKSDFKKPPTVDLNAPDVEAFWEHIDAGELHQTRGSLAHARTEFQAAEQIAERILKQYPTAPVWQRLLGVSFNRLGDVAQSSGDLSEARRRFTASYDIRQLLALSDLDNREWQRDLSVSHQRLGDLALTMGDVAEASRHFAAGSAITEHLASSDPDDTELQRDLSVNYNKLGDIARAGGDLAEARRRFTAGLEIAEGLAASDSGNRQWRRDVSVSHDLLGLVAHASGDLAEARRSFAASLAITEGLATSDPDNSQWQHDWWMSQSRMAAIALAEGEIAAAIGHFRASLPLIEALVARSPELPKLQSDLAFTRRRLVELESKSPG